MNIILTRALCVDIFDIFLTGRKAVVPDVVGWPPTQSLIFTTRNTVHDEKMLALFMKRGDCHSSNLDLDIDMGAKVNIVELDHGYACKSSNDGIKA